MIYHDISHLVWMMLNTGFLRSRSHPESAETQRAHRGLYHLATHLESFDQQKHHGISLEQQMGAMGDGKHTENYGKSQCLIGRSTINIYKWLCSIAMLVY